MLPYLFYFDGETELAACVLRATTENGREWILNFWPQNDLAPLLRWRRHSLYNCNMERQWFRY